MGKQHSKNNKRRTTTKKIKSRYFYDNTIHIIEVDPQNIKIKTTIGTLQQDGINGTYYNLKGKEIYGVAIQDNKPLEKNSYVTNYNGYKRATIYYNGKEIKQKSIYNAKTEIQDNIKWAISGTELYPYYNPKKEGFIGQYADILRKTNHTAIGYNKNKIYLMVATNQTLDNFRKNILNSKVAFEGIINLDGGGSTQMRYQGKGIIVSSRKLNHYIAIEE